MNSRSFAGKISYDWRGMLVEFSRNDACIDIHEQIVCGTVKLLMEYDGSGRRISKTCMRDNGNGVRKTEQVPHYTGIGTEVRENFAGPTKETKVIVNMPQGLGRYGIEDAEKPDFGGRTGDQLAGYIPNVKFEWYLKNHLGSTMLVYGTEGNATSDPFRVSAPLAAYDYRAFGEQVTLTALGQGDREFHRKRA